MSTQSRRLGVLSLCLLTLAGCGGAENEAQPETEAEWSGLDFGAISETLLRQMDLQPDEQVLIVGQAGRWDGLVSLLEAGIDGAGAVRLGAVDVFGSLLPASTPTDFADELARTAPASFEAYLDGVDLGIMLPGVTATEAEFDVYRAMQGVLRSGKGRTVHFHWAGATAFDGETLADSDGIDELYQNALLQTDYESLAQDLRAFESAMRSGEVRVTTPAGTDLTFRVEDRPVTRQDGDASMARATAARNLIDREVELPPGAVRVSPVLTTVEGTIAFPAADWSGVRVEGLMLRFEEGRIVEATADIGLEAFQEETGAAGLAGQSFRELAVGFNPLLEIPDGEEWIPYYGYGAGVIRLSLGDNTELGGSVSGGYVRWNFFTDATVEIDGFSWVVNGRLAAQ
ncbi:MAG: aminopeptidase [Longimicrobiales bacterium]